MPQASIPRKGKEEGLGAPEPLVADGDDLSVRQLVGLFQGGGGGGSGNLLLEVKSNIAQLLLNVPDNLPLGSGGEGLAPLCEDLHQVVSEVTASKVKPEDGVGKSVAFIDGDTVGDTVTGVHDDTGGTAGGVQGEHSMIWVYLSLSNSLERRVCEAFVQVRITLLRAFILVLK